MPLRSTTAARAAACALLALSFSVLPAATQGNQPKVQSPWAGAAATLPGRLELENFDNGLASESYSDTTPGNAGSAYRTTDVDIYALAGASNGHYVGAIANNEWLEFSVNVTQPGTYTFSIRHAGTAADSSIALNFEGSAPFTTLTLPSSGGATTFTTTTYTPFNLPTGSGVLRASFPKGGVNIDWIEFTKVPDLPSVRLLSPAATLNVNAPATVMLEAAAVDIGSTITQVEFVDFFTGNVIGTDASPPYQFNWTNVAAGSYSVRARATNAAGGQAMSGWRVVNARSAAPFPSAAAVIPGRIQAENFDSGNATFDTTPGTVPSSYRGAVVGPDLVAGSFGLGVHVVATEWMEYTVVVQHSGLYDLSFHTSAINWDARFAVLVNNLDVSGNLVPTNTASYNAFHVGTREQIFLPAGPTVLRIAASAGEFTLDWIEFTATNRAPVVTMTSPAQNTSVARPATLSLAATASDADGSITQVEFLNGSTVIGTDTTAPYAMTWAPPSNVAMAYALTARATDNLGQSTIATAISVAVTTTTNVAPTVSMTAPAESAIFALGSSVELAATATDPDGSIAHVEFLRGDTLIATDSTPPYSVVWSAPPAGPIRIVARAVDNQGGRATSPPRDFTMDAPTRIAMVPPVAGVYYPAPTTVTLRALAYDIAGIRSVTFLRGANVIGQDFSAPFELSGVSIGNGTHEFTARAEDVGGATTNSLALALTVSPTAPAGGQWPYRGIGKPANATSIPIEAEDYDHGGAGIAFAEIDAITTPNSYRPNDTDVDLTQSADFGAFVSNIRAGEWLEYTVKFGDLPYPTTYAVAWGTSVRYRRITSIQPGTAVVQPGTPIIRVEVLNGSNVVGRFPDIVAEGSANEWVSGVMRIGTTDFAYGEYIVRLTALTANIEIDQLQFFNLGGRPVVWMSPPETIHPRDPNAADQIEYRTAPVSQTFSATRNGDDGSTCGYIEFFVNGALRTSRPIHVWLEVANWDWQNIPVGTWQVRARCTEESGLYGESKALTLNVTGPLSPQAPFGGAARRPPADYIRAAEFDTGGQGVSYFDQDLVNSGNSIRRPMDSVDLRECPLDNEVVVDDFRPGEWMEYTIDVPGVGGDYLFSAQGYSGSSTPAGIRVMLNGNVLVDRYQLSTIEVPPGRCYYSPSAGPSPRVRIPAGRHVLRIASLDRAVTLRTISITGGLPGSTVDGLAQPVRPNFAAGAGGFIEPLVVRLGETMQLRLRGSAGPLDFDGDVARVDFLRTPIGGEAADRVIATVNAAAMGTNEFRSDLLASEESATSGALPIGRSFRVFAKAVDGIGLLSSSAVVSYPAVLPLPGADPNRPLPLSPIPVAVVRPDAYRIPCGSTMLAPASSGSPWLRCSGSRISVGGAGSSWIVEAERFDDVASGSPSAPVSGVQREHGHGVAFFAGRGNASQGNRWRSDDLSVKCERLADGAVVNFGPVSGAVGQFESTANVCSAHRLRNGDWLRYSINVATTRSYRLGLRFREIVGASALRSAEDVATSVAYVIEDTDGREVAHGIAALEKPPIAAAGAQSTSGQSQGWQLQTVGDFRLLQGDYTMRLKVGSPVDHPDSQGNWLDVDHLVFSDSTVAATPKPEITSPTTGRRFATNAQIVATANVIGANATTTVTYTLNTIQLSPVNAPFERLLFPAGVPVPQGEYRLTATATTNGVTSAVSDAVVFHVDPLAPTSVSVTGPASVVVGQTARLTALVASGAPAASEVQFSFRRIGADTTLTLTAQASPWSVDWTPQEIGTYQVTARARIGSAWTSDSPVFPIAVRGSDSIPSDVDEGAPVSLAHELPAHDSTAGRSLGVAGVSGGAGTYSIPIVVPPGRGNVAPSLSLAYSSTGGNGVLGMGWQLSGLSSIHRCPQTLAQDGATRPILFDATDRICLDGARLVAVEGSSYGANGAVYRTELDGFIRVVQRGGSLGQAAVWFEATAKSGDRLFFGRVSDGDVSDRNGRVTPQFATGTTGTALTSSWLLVRRQDAVGNGIEFRYTIAGSGEHLISAINYTTFQGGAAPAATCSGDTRCVLFEYEARPDRSTSFAALRQFESSQRLKRVTTHVGAVPVRKYEVTYVQSTATRRSLIEQVQECASHPTSYSWTCADPTVFEWSQGAPSHRFRKLSLNGLQALLASAQNATPANSDDILLGTPGDIDGDGVTEISASVPGTTPGSRRVFVVRTNASRQPESAIEITGALDMEWVTSGISLHHQVDLNRDGRRDQVGVSATGRVRYRYWVGWPAPGVVGSADMLSFFSPWVDTTLELGPNVGGQQSFVQAVTDVDGDGFSDVVIVRGDTAPGVAARAYIYRNARTTGTEMFGAMPVEAASIPLRRAATGTGRAGISRILDIDGDGLLDFIVTLATSINALSPAESAVHFGRLIAASGTNTTGTYSVTEVPITNLMVGGTTGLPLDSTGGSAVQKWIDVNGDGLEDLVFAAARQWKIRLNLGGRYSAVIDVQGPPTGPHPGLEDCIQGRCEPGVLPGGYRYNGHATPWDVDSDGRAEILMPHTFAMRACTRHYPEQPSTCPQAVRAPNGVGHLEVSGDLNRRCHDYYYCPETPGSTREGSGLNATMYFGTDGNGDGLVDAGAWPAPPSAGVSWPAFALHDSANSTDPSAYHMRAIRFRQTGTTAFEVESVDNTGIILNQMVQRADDLFGDGYTDAVLRMGCPWAHPDECAIPLAGAQDTVHYPAELVPRSLPDGGPILDRALYIVENLGPSPASGNPVPRANDLMVKATAGASAGSPGLEIISTWAYSPLTSNAGRTAGQTPLYTPVAPADADTGAANSDGQSLTFTSSMPVVATFQTSDGIGGSREVRYAYRKAVFNTLGRGFLGFREILEEDVAAGVRQRTVFRHRFPLVGAVERIETTRLSQAANSPALLSSHHNSSYLCWDTEQGTQAVSCETVPAPNNRPWLSYVAASTKTAFAPETTLSGTAGTAISVTSTSSVVSRNGNQTSETVSVTEGSGSGEGFAARVTTEVTTTRNYTPDSNNRVDWWLDRLSSVTETARSTYGTGHPLPAGAPESNGVSRLVTTRYEFNGNRTLAKTWVQESDTEQYLETNYAYPTPSYGSPSSTTVKVYDNASDLGSEASKRTLRSRVTTYGYSPDRYFVDSVTNPLGQTVGIKTRASDGQVWHETGIDGRVTLTEFDLFGVATRSCSPVDANASSAQDCDAYDNLTAPPVPTQRAPVVRNAVARCPEGGCASPFARARYFVTAVQNGTPTTTRYFDQLGRPVGATSRQIDGSLVTEFRSLDARGLELFTSEPLGQGQPALGRWTQYDVLGRPMNSTLSRALDECGDLIETYDYAGRQTSVTQTASNPTCAVSRTTSRVVDASGRLLIATDARTRSMRYWYDGLGNTIALRDVENALTFSSYDSRGRRRTSVDPNQGTWLFRYDGLGELLRQTDARGATTQLSYDLLGRTLTRVHATLVNNQSTVQSTDTFTYDPLHAPGALASQAREYGATLERRDVFSYEPQRGFLTAVATTQHQVAGSVVTSFSHDRYYGALRDTTYPTGDVVRSHRGRYGHSTGESHLGSGTRLRQVLALSPRGRPTLETIGGVFDASTEYEPTTGDISILSYTRFGQALRLLDYQYDVFGNVKSQSLTRPSQTTRSEAFQYDSLDRLTKSTRAFGSGLVVDYGYSDAGNLLKKTDFSADLASAYQYGTGTCGGGPNAVKSVSLKDGGVRSYAYDANGNMTGMFAGANCSQPGSSIFSASYDVQNLPTQVVRSGVTLDFRYGPDGARTRQTSTGGDPNANRFYFGSYERVAAVGTEHRISIGGYAVLSRSGTGATTFNYILRDRLGSVEAIVDTAGAIVQNNEHGFDPFGKPRGADWGDLAVARLPSTSITPRGFTQHEHLNAVELIHMNGRAFDYNLGRFLSVDPVIQFKGNTQSINPYSYILNNPLAGTDPSGFAYHCGSKSAVQCARWALAGGFSGRMLVVGHRAIILGPREIPGPKSQWPSFADNGDKQLPAINVFGSAEESQREYERMMEEERRRKMDAELRRREDANQRVIARRFEKLLLESRLRSADEAVSRSSKVLVGGTGAIATLSGGAAVVFSGVGAAGVQSAVAWCLGNPIGCNVALGEAAAAAGGSATLGMPSSPAGLVDDAARAASRDMDIEVVARVGRWMSRSEHEAMVATGRVQESMLNGVTSVSRPGDPAAWIRQSGGARYVEFDVPASALHGAGSNSKIYGPNSIFGPKLGIAEMPSASNIVHTACRLPMRCP